MSSKAGSSKRVGEDITKQAKKVKGIDVRRPLALHPGRSSSCSTGSLQQPACPPCAHSLLQDVLRLVKKLAEQSRKNTDKEK